MTKTILIVGMPSERQQIVIDAMVKDHGYIVEHKSIEDYDKEQLCVIGCAITVDELHKFPALGMPKEEYRSDHRRSKGEKKRQRSEWNSNIKGYRK